jgi:cell fate regulator YaaT (PSP1 superfamily)
VPEASTVPAPGPGPDPDPELSTVDSRPSTPAEPWGDDRDAPTPEVKLAPDLPVEARDPDGEDIAGDLDLPPPPGIVTNVAGVKLVASGKIYDADAGDATYRVGERVLVEHDRGSIVATVAIASSRQLVTEPIRKIIRRAEARDVPPDQEKQSEDALKFAKERARARKMPIKVYRVDVQPSGGRAVCYFSSEDRIDFRELVRDLTNQLRLRVEMRQTGVRDEAKMVGGIGSCGRELCCTTFLPRFEPVSIKMAKDQGLVLNPTKVTGQCGRLKCCLVYEEAAYAEARKGLPKLGKRVSTPAGEGRVAEVDVLRRRIRVSFQPGEFLTFPAESVTAMAPLPPPGKNAPVVKEDFAEGEPERSDGGDPTGFPRRGDRTKSGPVDDDPE